MHGGTRAIVPILPVCPPASWPWATRRSIPASAMRLAFLMLPVMASTLTPLAWASSTMDPGLPSPAQKRGICLLYTSDAADDLLCVDLGGRRIIKKKKKKHRKEKK